eukprot:CAMPEP_0167758264 /NCGR_PEP_ID=MMETSP0110_2-20121227/10373_1 /TAXON_ID=629695 /ORGANISM="Gymnochlora sp., Strain CCMP2014" /LENGTH=136 /DNA_ID=CAMNT_0007644523 /DNA_START=110 /DNA_END=518 /DNA_ORIENTATION=+
MNLDGKTLFERAPMQDEKEKKNDDASQSIHHIVSLKKAAVDFGKILNCDGCPVMHIRGSNHIFSSYSLVDDTFLALFSSLHAAMASSFNTTQADRQMVPIVKDLCEALGGDDNEDGDAIKEIDDAVALLARNIQDE